MKKRMLTYCKPLRSGPKATPRKLSCALAFLHLCIPMVLAGCIDDNLDDCPPDETDFEVEYNVRLQTNMEMELNTVLSASAAEAELARRLRDALSNTFRNYAHDVDLSFYEITGDSVRLHHERHIMDAEQASYTLTLPVRDYMHLAIANIDEEAQAALQNDDYAPLSQLAQAQADTLPSQQTGIFTARLPMIMTGGDQTFDVRLYMANCASALVIDPNGVTVSDIRVFVTDLADAFAVRDSVYHYAEHPAVVRSRQMTDTGSELMCWYATHFPSRDEPPPVTRADGSTVPDDAVWRMPVYVTLLSGKVTRNLIYSKTPMHAGTLNIIKIRLNALGIAETDNPDIAVGYDLDWRPGGNYTPEM